MEEKCFGSRFEKKKDGLKLIEVMGRVEAEVDVCELQFGFMQTQRTTDDHL